MLCILYNGYVYSDENLMLIPQNLYNGYNLSIMSKYAINKAEYDKIETILSEKMEQVYTAENKL